ncbi:hypothetical protein GCM10020366_69730 [Saccharopolyspora gregorii]|uniref:Uncharacterized protein n=1 Tax=Saccharopolyspora gregorii TaxID=33914 RepID=A0ABP6S2X5_9PSEU
MVMRQSTRSFVESVDFTSSVGYGRGPGDRSGWDCAGADR